MKHNEYIKLYTKIHQSYKNDIEETSSDQLLHQGSKGMMGAT